MDIDIIVKSADVNWLKITYVCMHVERLSIICCYIRICICMYVQGNISLVSSLLYLN